MNYRNLLLYPSITLFSLLLLPAWVNAEDSSLPFQERFELRSSFQLGIADRLSIQNSARNKGFVQDLSLETRGAYEWSKSSTRHRLRYLESNLILGKDIEVRGKLLSYSNGRHTGNPAFWITTFFGEPQRYDVYMNLGWGFTAGRIELRPGITKEADQSMLTVDMGQFDLNWEVIHSDDFENYLQIKAGIGGGSRGDKDTAWDDKSSYVYPEVALKSEVTLDQRGLTEFSFEARGRHGFDTQLNWQEINVEASIERVFIALNDQPLSIFLRPEFRYYRTKEIETLTWQAFAGIHLSLFSADRDSRDSDDDGIVDLEDQCPNHPEDYDRFQDEDGCPEEDNDGDGIHDSEDLCPLIKGVIENEGCPTPPSNLINLPPKSEDPLNPDDREDTQKEEPKKKDKKKDKKTEKETKLKTRSKDESTKDCSLEIDLIQRLKCEKEVYKNKKSED